MCDLWKNTTNAKAMTGVIPGQIEYALSRMPPVKHLKLYNSGSFFDAKAVPGEDYDRIASLVADFETVIVESHPLYINERCLTLRDKLKPELQIAMGLETVNPGILSLLNKHMTLQDFENSVRFLGTHRIRSRAFILLKPPFLSEEEGIYWAERSIDFAFNTGVECCTVIPVRAGNGAMDQLLKEGLFSPPDIRSLEKVLEYGIGLGRGRVFADVWDISLFSLCPQCTGKRVSRLTEMNLHQTEVSRVVCLCDSF
jgi:radical SAM enzyme (TIGR01210 family)